LVLLVGESAADTDTGLDAGAGMELGSDMAPTPTRLARVFFFFMTPFLATPIGAKETPVPAGNELKAAGAGASIKEDEVEAVSEVVAGEDRAMAGGAVSVAGVDMRKLKALEGDNAAAAADSAAAAAGCRVSSAVSSVVVVAVSFVGDGITKEKADPAVSASGAAAGAGSEVVASTGAAAVIAVKKENPLLAAGAGGSADTGTDSEAANVVKKEKDDGAGSGAGAGAEAPLWRKEKALLGPSAGAGAGASAFSSFPPLISSPPNMISNR
jgi:hypothetical protein